MDIEKLIQWPFCIFRPYFVPNFCVLHKLCLNLFLIAKELIMSPYELVRFLQRCMFQLSMFCCFANVCYTCQGCDALPNMFMHIPVTGYVYFSSVLFTAFGSVFIRLSLYYGIIGVWVFHLEFYHLSDCVWDPFAFASNRATCG